MHSKRLIIIVAACVIAILTAAVILIFQAPVGWKIFGLHTVPGDRRVPWVEPPGRFDPVGGRVQSAPPDTVPGGFIDYAGRTLHFRGLVSTASADWAAESTGIAFDELRKAGINVITVPVRWQDLEPAPLQVSVDTILAIRKFLDHASARGIGVILVNTTPISSAAGCPWAPDAPMWAFRDPPTHSTVDGIECVQPDSGDLSASSGFRTDFLDARWTPDNITLQDHLIRAWTKLAEVSSRSAGLIGYGLADGMACPADMDATACSKAWTGYVDRFANGVRAVDGTALFFLDTDGPDGSKGTSAITVTEIVPGSADDSARGPVTKLPSGSFTLDHNRVDSGASFLETVDAIERRGRSWLVKYPESTSGTRAVATGILPNAIEMARPRPDAVAGKNMRFGFDRLVLPEGPDDTATEPGTTDVFTLEFDDIPARGTNTAETTVWLPADSLYKNPVDSDSPAWTVEISDGTAGWLPGQTDVILWRTIDGFGTHKMKIVPWGGRRLGPPAAPAPDSPAPSAKP